MFKHFRTAALLAAAALLVGCATPTRMAFQNDTDKLSNESKPVYLMTATMKNGYKTSYQPKVFVVNVEKKDAQNASDRLNFLVDDKARSEPDTFQSGNSYFVRMELDKGDYVLRGLTGFSGFFPVRGMFFAPVHADMALAHGSGVYYLGHVEAMVRERKENEFRAGPPIPLIDQAVTGFSGGTFDIEITDQFDKDEAMFRSRFPALRDVPIQKAILAPFDRDKAQKWWEAH